MLPLPRPALPDLAPLIELVASADRLAVLTGAGCSTESGIPDYRSPRATPRTEPMRYVEFTRSAQKRQRYWARAAVGWAHVGQAKPNPAHHALAALEAQGKVYHPERGWAASGGWESPGHRAARGIGRGDLP